MRLGLWLLPLSLSACVDAGKCGMPQPWKPCSGVSAEPGSSGTPPSIVSFATASCAYVATPAVSGSLHVSDPDGDAQVAHIIVAQGGGRLDETDDELDDAHRAGDDWTGPITIGIADAMVPASFDVRVKVVDQQGNQGVPVCNTITLLQ